MSIFSRRRAAHDEEQPGADVSSPMDTEGTGRPVGLQDRTRPNGQGSPDTNQGKTEPMPPTPGHADPDGADSPASTVGPTLGEMSIGGAPSQLPTGPPGLSAGLPGLKAGDVPQPQVPRHAGTVPAGDRPQVDPSSSVGGAAGPGRPVQRGQGTAQRAPRSQGVSPEEQETDVQAGAAQMTRSLTSARGDAVSTPQTRPSGDTHGVPSAGETASGGTSEELDRVQGVRAALPPEDTPA